MMEQGLIDIRKQARKQEIEKGIHSAYLISCGTLLAILDELEAAQKEVAALQKKRDEATKLRRNFAKYLAPAYLKNPPDIAELCDESLDRTGALLGYVRDEAASPQERP